jgi:hypothetical protein
VTNLIWLGGAAASLYLAVLSFAARKWWPVAYIFALALGFGTGVLIWDWPEPARQLWWLGWIIYMVTMPIGKTIAARRRERGDY